MTLACSLGHSLLRNNMGAEGANVIVNVVRDKPQMITICGIKQTEVDFSHQQLNFDDAILLAFDLRKNSVLVQLKCAAVAPLQTKYQQPLTSGPHETPSMGPTRRTRPFHGTPRAARGPLHGPHTPHEAPSMVPHTLHEAPSMGPRVPNEAPSMDPTRRMRPPPWAPTHRMRTPSRGPHAPHEDPSMGPHVPHEAPSMGPHTPNEAPSMGPHTPHEAPSMEPHTPHEAP